MDRIYQSYKREVALLFDFDYLLIECKRMVAQFRKFGFELVLFEDGYFIEDKKKTICARQKKRIGEKRKKLKIMEQLHRRYVRD